MAYNRSKSKGNRIEYAIRDLFREKGYEAHRVPASGAAQAFPGDLLVIDGDRKLLVEVKARKDEFKHIYAFVDSQPTSRVAFYDFKTGIGAIVSYSYQDIKVVQFAGVEPTKDHKRILKLKKYLGKSDILVIKQDRKPPLFIRFI